METFSKLWHCYNENNTGNEMQECNLNQVFANHSKEEEIFPLTIPEIAEAQKADIKLKHCFKRNAVVVKDWMSDLLTIHTWFARMVG